MSCKVSECSSPDTCRGYCSKHYQRWRKHGDPQWEPPAINSGDCKISDCGYPATKRGWCDMHYQRWREHGDPLWPGIGHVRHVGDSEILALYSQGLPLCEIGTRVSLAPCSISHRLRGMGIEPKERFRQNCTEQSTLPPGTRVGFLIVITGVPYRISGEARPVMDVRCDCGNERIMIAAQLKHHLIRGKTLSCSRSCSARTEAKRQSASVPPECSEKTCHDASTSSGLCKLHNKRASKGQALFWPCPVCGHDVGGRTNSALCLDCQRSMSPLAVALQEAYATGEPSTLEERALDADMSLSAMQKLENGRNFSGDGIHATNTHRVPRNPIAIIDMLMLLGCERDRINRVAELLHDMASTVRAEIREGARGGDKCGAGGQVGGVCCGKHYAQLRQSGSLPATCANIGCDGRKIGPGKYCRGCFDKLALAIREGRTIGIPMRIIADGLGISASTAWNINARHKEVSRATVKTELEPRAN